MAETKVLLTEKDVERWKEEKAELEDQIAATQQKLLKVMKRLEAAAVLIGDIGSSVESPNRTDLEPDEESLKPMTDAALRVVEIRGGVASRSDIKAELRKAGYPESRLGNYFYTVLARHVQRGRLIKRGNVYRRVLGSAVTPEDEEAPSKPGQVDLLGASFETGLAVQ